MFSSRKALTWLGCIVAVVGVALLSDALFTRLILSSESVEAGRVGRIINGTGGADEIPIFGASKAEADYVPDVLGPGYYNYGFSAASPEVVNTLLTYELKVGHAKTIVIELFPGKFADIGDVRNYIPYARLPEIAQLIRSQDKWQWYYAVPGLRYFGSYDWYLKGILSDHLRATHEIRRGYSVEFNAIAWRRDLFEQDIQRRVAQPPLQFGILPDQARRFLELINSAPDRKFIIVISPLHKSYLHDAVGEPAFRQQLAVFARLPNVRIIDFMHAPYPDEYFRDTGHLNYRGAQIFSAELKAAIANAGRDEAARH
ncbi:MAG: hypothetical protein JWR80_4935 [Bradyrhizobium sp.]|nr:hypothetical protein [Bradyrhizobium sp.]